ncbi:hypothetical protein [Bradyrhizobium nanningense]|uniref:hypothetical protein n=1 Tax=Bradyrhizobium nanningense TaxID=1325118 RepID=UPI001ABF8E84|nr:hypothetical protein [Bradyrhizobium nanningense]
MQLMDTIARPPPSKSAPGSGATGGRKLRILIDALAALDLELVIQPRTQLTAEAIEDLF